MSSGAEEPPQVCAELWAIWPNTGECVATGATESVGCVIGTKDIDLVGRPDVDVDESDAGNITLLLEPSGKGNDEEGRGANGPMEAVLAGYEVGCVVEKDGAYSVGPGTSQDTGEEVIVGLTEVVTFRESNRFGQGNVADIFGISSPVVFSCETGVMENMDWSLTRCDEGPEAALTDKGVIAL